MNYVMAICHIIVMSHDIRSMVIPICHVHFNKRFQKWLVEGLYNNIILLIIFNTVFSKILG